MIISFFFFCCFNLSSRTIFMFYFFFQRPSILIYRSREFWIEKFSSFPFKRRETGWSFKNKHHSRFMSCILYFFLPHFFSFSFFSIFQRPVLGTRPISHETMQLKSNYILLPPSLCSTFQLFCWMRVHVHLSESRSCDRSEMKESRRA